MRRQNLPLPFIILLAAFSLFVVLPISNVHKSLFAKVGQDRELKFKEGLDLSGGVSLTFRADMATIPETSQADALEAARQVLERRVNLFGVSEALVQTSVAASEHRIIVELPGVADIEKAKSQIGRTAELTFWERIGDATSSAEVATSSAVQSPGIPLGLTQDFKKTNLSGRDLKTTVLTYDPNNGAPVIQLTFTEEGRKKFANITQRNVGKPLAIVLDNVAVQAPTINEVITNGDAVISGGFTVESAKEAVKQLNAGALPVTLTPISQHVIGPTLGSESLKKSLFAGVLGFVVIVLFMIYLYRLSGVVASIALFLYILFSLAIFKLSSITPYSITLTLAGIAGFILSIGMAVDANILIFERMKEETKSGKSKIQALEVGFARAWSSIRDSNVATLITAFILYQFGTGTVRGFALILAIGVLISMFSAITVTRTLLRFINKS